MTNFESWLNDVISDISADTCDDVACADMCDDVASADTTPVMSEAAVQSQHSFPTYKTDQVRPSTSIG